MIKKFCYIHADKKPRIRFNGKVVFPFVTFKRHLKKEKKRLSEEYPILKTTTLFSIIKWGFALNDEGPMFYSFDELRYIWNANFPDNQLSLGKSGALSQGEIRFIVREYAINYKEKPEDHTQIAISSTIKKTMEEKQQVWNIMQSQKMENSPIPAK